MYDILVIGGGINGVGIAAEMAGRGLSVFLCEQDDFASHTSSASSKLIHGGLRYLEQFQFRLVKEALTERDILLHIAPHLVRPQQFIMPCSVHTRPAWMIQLGLFLYDHLYWHKTLPKSQKIGLSPASSNPLQPHLTQGFSYFDCTTDDARLVISNALQAAEKGATLKTRLKAIKAERVEQVWQVTCQNTLTSEIQVVEAKSVVNATGAWVSDVLENCCHVPSPYRVKMVKGSHLVLPRLYAHPNAYLLQNEDKRVIFVIPYQHHFTLIGTTDVVYTGDPGHVVISPEEQDYLLKVYNAYFKTTASASEVVHAWSGVRPLYDDHHANPSSITRDYKLTLQTQDNLPLLSVFGGKLTTYRALAERAFELLAPFFPEAKAYNSAQAILPGGHLSEPLPVFTERHQREYPTLPPAVIARWCETYGDRISYLLSGVKIVNDLGALLGPQLFEKEVQYLKEHEWAVTEEDILWRRTKVGLLKTPPP
jgi:glycerol-3-phosphate dehydrogenase